MNNLSQPSPQLTRQSFHKWAALLVALALGTLLLASSPSPTEAANPAAWEEIQREDGIVVTQKWPKGYELPVIRGKGVVKANIYEILAILDDTPRNPEWMDNCKSTQVLKNLSDTERIVYARFNMPWPVTDRDAVLQTSVTRHGDVIKAQFWTIKSPLKKEDDDYVRVPRMKGIYTLKSLGPNKTHVTYQAEAEPGGLLPNLLVAQASKDIPYKTIINLRKQARKTRGQYSDFLKAWDPALGGKGI